MFRKACDDMSFGLYIHIPFCRSKCPYCDFFSIANADAELKKRYIDALAKEIRLTGDFFSEEGKNGLRLDSPSITSIYFGGGTPSLLEKEDFVEVFSAISDTFGNSYMDYAEITIETNPGTVSFEKLRMLADFPFNRLSLGVQSFDDGILKKLGRVHSSADCYRTIKEARDAGFSNISIDLMFGMEWQSFEIWMDTVERAAELKPEHISLYSLEIQDDTEFGRRLKAGTMFETDPEVDRRMYEEAINYLELSGYEQYEISNLSYVGERNETNVCEKTAEYLDNHAVDYGRNYRSKHNLKYWGLEEYIGYGAGAHSYVLNKLTGKSRRYYHEKDIDSYMNNPGQVIFCEENEVADDIQEYTITSLRKNEGISKREFFEKFGVGFWEFYGDLIRMEFNSFVETGYAEETEERIKLTISGFNVSNRILALFV